MRHRRFRLAVIAVAAVGLSANAASATTRADAGPSAQVCKEGYFCLWEGSTRPAGCSSPRTRT